MKEKAQTLAIRTGLINTVSNKIRESFDINEIIQTTVDEISKTLGVSHGFYAEISNCSEPFIKHIWIEENEKIKDLHKNFPPREMIYLKKPLKAKLQTLQLLYRQ